MITNIFFKSWIESAYQSLENETKMTYDYLHEYICSNKYISKYYHAVN